MDTLEFWRIVDAAVKKDELNLKEQITEIENELSDYSIEDIRAFNYVSEKLIEKAKNDKLFEAISKTFKDQIVFKGGVSWNSYEFFIGWLLMQGSEVFNSALVSPDYLNDLITNNYNNDLSKCSCEEAIFIAGNAYEIKTGRDYFEDFDPPHSSSPPN